jgi:6-phosphogluconolactonase (cycloisomerase 2 family)
MITAERGKRVVRVRYELLIIPSIFSMALVAALFVNSSPSPGSVAAEYLYLETPAGNLATYRIGSDGSLDLTGSLAPSWPANVKFPYAVHVWFSVQPGGRFAYSSPLAGWSYLLEYYRIDQISGALNPNPAAASRPVRFQGPIQFSPSGAFLYIDDAGTGLISPYRVDEVSGSLTPSGQGVRIPGLPLRTLVFAQSGRYAYILGTQSNNVASYRVAADGAMKPVAPFNVVPTEAGLDSLAVDPGGHFAYVANSRDDTISQYFIDPYNGALRANPKNSTIGAGHAPGSLVIDATGRFLYAISALLPGSLENVAISRFKIDDDGQLTSLGEPLNLSGSALNFGPMVTEPSGKFLYLPISRSRTDFGKTLLYGFKIGEGGRLETLPSPPVPILEDTGPLVSWIGPKPIARVAERTVTPLLAIRPSIAGTFTPAGPMIKRRNWRATPMLLADGRVFFLESDEWQKSSAEIYDPKKGGFSSFRLPPGMTGGNLVSELQGNRFLISFPADNNRVSIFDPHAVTMTPNGRLTGKCHNLHWILADGRILFHYSPQFLEFNSCGGEIYDPASAASEQEPADLQKMNILAEIKGDRFLVFPRPSPPLSINPDNIPGNETISIYDLGSRHIQKIGDIPRRLAYYNESVSLKDGRLLLVGALQERDVVELFDPASGKFSSIGASAQGHGMGVFLTLLKDGRVLISGGAGRSDTELFDPATMTFVPTGNMIQFRNAKGIQLHDGTVLLAGGVFDGSGFSAGGSPPDDAEIYHPLGLLEK